MYSRYLLLRLLPILCPLFSEAAVINGYAEVTALGSNTLTIGASNESAAQFLAGKDIIIMQMQDDVIGTNTADNATFGTLSDIRSAGLFVVSTISSVTRNGSNVLLTITLNASVGTTFHFGANSSVQAITYEKPGGNGDHTTTVAMDALAWNGSIGGVLALQVKGTLTLQHSISADGKGFRGGARDPGTYDVCYPNIYRASSVDANTWRYATKGEGIYRLNTTDWADGRGRIINGGGGGNGINAGGGGGGNYTQGGEAGPGYSCSSTPSGGLGGSALSSNAGRVFMGGGGGGGEGNDNISTDGAIGGGIILIKAAALRTAGSTAVTISSNGSNAAPAQNDGAGGGGAGGSIVLQVASYNVIAAAPLTVRANGGSGGSINHGSDHGAGGGGGQGTVIYSVVRPTTNITTQTINGAGGCNNNSAPCNSLASTALGTNGTGILQNSGGVLPIELLHFGATPWGGEVKIDWSTASESDNAAFIVERSTDAVEWTDVIERTGAGNSTAVLNYEAVDALPLQGQSYYRLRQVDFDGTASWSDIVPVRMMADDVKLDVYPNPANDLLEVRASGGASGRMELRNSLGQPVAVPMVWREGHATIDVSGLPSGSYTVILLTGERVLPQRVIVRH